MDEEREAKEAAKIWQEYATPATFLLMLETLAFYADADTYFAIGIIPDAPCGEFATDFDDINMLNDRDEVCYTVNRPGKRARDAIQQVLCLHNTELNHK